MLDYLDTESLPGTGLQPQDGYNTLSIHILRGSCRHAASDICTHRLPTGTNIKPHTDHRRPCLRGCIFVWHTSCQCNSVYLRRGSNTSHRGIPSRRHANKDSQLSLFVDCRSHIFVRQQNRNTPRLGPHYSAPLWGHYLRTRNCHQSGCPDHHWRNRIRDRQWVFHPRKV